MGLLLWNVLVPDMKGEPLVLCLQLIPGIGTISTPARGSSAALNPLWTPWIFEGGLPSDLGIVQHPGKGEETVGKDAAHKVALLRRAV